ncbi:UNVERIFIED_CONTAM: hypothetical protein FKN15_025620 [Acipenser sinensis]
MESITLKVHAVVEFSFKDYTIDRVKNKQAASCLHCKAKICEKLGTSSNWKTKHPDRCKQLDGFQGILVPVFHSNHDPTCTV